MFSKQDYLGYKVSLTSLFILAGFFLSTAFVYAEMCEDTYDSFSCNSVSNCDSDQDELVGNKWEEKSVGGYTPGDSYITNIEGGADEVNLCTQPVFVDDGDKVCCVKETPPAPPPAPVNNSTYNVLCTAKEGFYVYCLEYAGDVTDKQITDTADILKMNCKISEKTNGACPKPNCWNYVANYGCIEDADNAPLACGVKSGSQCNTCESAMSLPACKTGTKAACKEKCEQKPECSHVNNTYTCVQKPSDQTIQPEVVKPPRDFMYDEEAEAVRLAQKGKIEGLAKSTFHLIGDRTPQQVFGGLIKALMGILGSIALGMFVYGGFMIMGGGGNSERIGKGTQIVIWSALGVVVIFASYTLVQFVLDIL